MRSCQIWDRYSVNMNLRYIKLLRPKVSWGEEHFRTQTFFSQTYGIGDI